jgi:hypothetical protein
MVTVAIVDHMNTMPLADLENIAAALQRQVREHFAPFWNMTAAVYAAVAPQPVDWVIGLFEKADQPGALGYHDETPAGLPLAKVFPLLDKQDNQSLSVTISHELLEMLADPYLSRATQDHTGKFWAMEVCDACENDQYKIDGVDVSDFVTPHYFEPPTKRAKTDKLDYLNLIKTPYEVRPGGYMQYFDPTQGWQQVVHREIAARAYRQRVEGRAGRRAGVRV